jgi:hypothetical protein
MPDILALLIAERDRFNRAIAALAESTPKRRGRPPKMAGEVPARRRPRSAAARKAQSRRMRKYWAARRKQKAAK